MIRFTQYSSCAKDLGLPRFHRNFICQGTHARFRRRLWWFKQGNSDTHRFVQQMLPLPSTYHQFGLFTQDCRHATPSWVPLTIPTFPSASAFQPEAPEHPSQAKEKREGKEKARWYPPSIHPVALRCAGSRRNHLVNL